MQDNPVEFPGRGLSQNGLDGVEAADPILTVSGAPGERHEIRWVSHRLTEGEP